MASRSALGRFTEIQPEGMSAQQRALARFIADGVRGKVPTPFKIWLSNPEFAARMERLANYVVRETPLLPREVEIAVLVLADRMNAEFVISAHRRRGAQVGLEAEVMDALCAGRAPQLTSVRESTVRDLAFALASGAEVDDALYERAVAALGHDGIAALTGLLGFYCSCAFVLRCYQVPVKSE